MYGPTVEAGFHSPDRQAFFCVRARTVVINLDVYEILQMLFAWGLETIVPEIDNYGSVLLSVAPSEGILLVDA